MYRTSKYFSSLLFISFCFCSIFYGQSPQLDSLQKVLEEASMTDSAEVLRALERSHIFRGEFDDALKYALQLLTLRQKAEDSSKIAASLSNIGIIYSQLKDYKKSREYYEQSLRIDSLIGNDIGVAAGLNNLGLLLADQGEYDQALDFYNRSLMIKATINDTAGTASTLNNIGLLYEEGENEYDKAIAYYEQALSLFEDLNDGWNVANSNSNLGISYLKKKDYNKANKYLVEAYELAEREAALPMMISNLGYQAQLNEEIQNYSQDYQLKTKELVLYDSMFNSEKVKEITRIQEEYNAAIKDKEIELLKSKNQLQEAQATRSYLIIILLLIAVIASFVIIYLISRTNLMRKKAALVLRRERDNIQQYIDQAEAIFLLLNWRGEIQMINRRGCEILEYSDNELLGENAFEKLIPEEKKEELFAYHKHVIEGQAAPHQQLELNLLSKSGKSIYISWTQSIIYNHDGSPHGILTHASDVTLIHEAENREKLALINGQELERRRIAEDLHDGIGPMLSATKLHMGQLMEPQANSSDVIHKTKALLDQTIQEVRAISQNLSATRVQHLGLEKAMIDVCDQIRHTNTLKVDFQTFKIPEDLEEMKALAIFRIFQELVHNVLLHAEAKHLNIQVLNHTDHILLMVEDDGKGFIYEHVKTKGMGLYNTFMRVKALNGICDIDSQEGRGSLITVEIPV